MGRKVEVRRYKPGCYPRSEHAVRPSFEPSVVTKHENLFSNRKEEKTYLQTTVKQVINSNKKLYQTPFKTTEKPNN
jgi:hypothetical protein